MNILFDLNHPAHFHLFKNTIGELKEKGHQIWITARNKDVLLQLLESNQFQYILLRKSDNKLNDHFKNLNQLRSLFRKESIDIAVGVSALITQASVFTKTKSIVLDDDDIKATPLFAFAAHSLANHVISPSVLRKERNRKKDIFHDSLHELAYLHPNHLKPEKSILEKYGLKETDTFFVLRLSALNAHHDVGEKGISNEKSIKIVKLLESKGKVFISSESELPTNLKSMGINDPLDFHHLLAFTRLLVCDSQTVVSEASVLGVPSVRINSFVGRISYLEELEHKYHLTFGFKPNQFDLALAKILELMGGYDATEFEEKKDRLLSEKIDLTAFLIWFIENYPESAKIMKENPDYQYNFK